MNRIPVFFRPEMVAPKCHSIAPGTFKPGACIDDWQAHGLDIELRDFAAATGNDLCLAHDPAYVDGILAGRVRNGFGNTRADVAASLAWTTGAMVAAAEEALLAGGVACAPVSGFHHAHWDASSGYCTFNGLVVAARHLLQRGYARRVGILDLDQHWGDGTESLRQRLNLQTRLRHDSPAVDSPRPDDAERFLRSLPDRVRAFGDCQVLLYQAGADAHVDDRFGGWMDDEQLARRDRIVFETALEIGLPVAWNLAGGYRTDAAGTIAPVLAVHRRTMQACIDVYVNAATGLGTEASARLAVGAATAARGLIA